MTVIYEWLAETIDEHGDIIDVTHDETLERLLDNCKPSDKIGLMRDRFDGYDMYCRTWSYIGSGSLDMLDAYDNPIVRIPKRYIAEAKRHGFSFA